MLTKYEITGIWFSLQNLWNWTQQNKPDNFTEIPYSGKWLMVSLCYFRKKIPDLTSEELTFAFNQLRMQYPNLHYEQKRGNWFYSLENSPTVKAWLNCSAEASEVF